MYGVDDFVAFLLRYKFELPTRLPDSPDDALAQTEYMERMQHIQETQSLCATCILVYSLNHGRDVHVALDYIDKAIQAWRDSVDDLDRPWLDRSGQATLVVGITLLLAITNEVEAVFAMFASYRREHQPSVVPNLDANPSDARSQIASYMLALSVHDPVEDVLERLFHTDPNADEYYVIKYLMFYQLFLITRGNGSFPCLSTCGLKNFFHLGDRSGGLRTCMRPHPQLCPYSPECFVCFPCTREYDQHTGSAFHCEVCRHAHSKFESVRASAYLSGVIGVLRGD